MPRPRWPHLHLQVSRHGKKCWYVRTGHGRRIRIRADFGTPEFEAEYHTAIVGAPAEAARNPESRTLQWLWERYCASSTWRALSIATRRQRENIMKHVLADSGQMPLPELTKRRIVDGRERRQATPSQANNFLNTMKGLLAWAVENGHMAENPSDGVKTLKRPRNEGFPDWTEEDAVAFEKRWPLGTRERLALVILLNTGLRRGDIARLGKQHFRDEVIEMRTEKTGTLVTIPVLAPLRAAITATKTGDLALIATPTGKPMTKESFGNWFREACDKAGIAKSAHGLRKLAATIVANNGASEAQLMALFGWTDPAMARAYTRKANVVHLAREAAKRLHRNET